MRKIFTQLWKANTIDFSRLGEGKLVNGWGGRRKGAGRPATGRKKRTMYITDDEYEVLSNTLKTLRNEKKVELQSTSIFWTCLLLVTISISPGSPDRLQNNYLEDNLCRYFLIFIVDIIRYGSPPPIKNTIDISTYRHNPQEKITPNVKRGSWTN